MTRKPPEIAAPEWTAPSDREELTFDLRVITPMFGGGYTAREVDPVTPIRAAAIRGHLRFWWRATRGAGSPSSSQLFARESEIWGRAGAEGDRNATSAIAVRVRTTSAGAPQACSAIQPPKPSPSRGPGIGFMVWPFQRSKVAKEATARAGVTFTVTVALERAQKDDVLTAVRAWAAFGGIGARTRRGCGALSVTGASSDLAPEYDSLEAWVKSLVGQPAPALRSSTGCPSLCGGMLVVAPEAQEQMECWQRLGGLWAAFRKGHVAPGTYSPMSGGRWQDYRGVLCRHQRSSGGGVALAKPFLGMPIEYQSFDSAPFSGPVGPSDTGRFASPVILKPVAFVDGTRRAAALILHAPAPGAVRIQNAAPVHLSEPTGDPVLATLKAASVLDGVRSFFERELGAKAIRL